MSIGSPGQRSELLKINAQKRDIFWNQNYMREAPHIFFRVFSFYYTQEQVVRDMRGGRKMVAGGLSLNGYILKRFVIWLIFEKRSQKP